MQLNHKWLHFATIDFIVPVMSKKYSDDLNCSLAETMNLIGEGWAILILKEAFLGCRRFEDFQKHLGVARNILTARLQKLVDDGILERIPVKQGAKRHEYKLTAMGRDLYPALIALTQWGDRWLQAPDEVPVKIIQRSSGEEIDTIRIRNQSGEEIDARDIAMVPGPGATDQSRERLRIMSEMVAALLSKQA